MAEPDFPSSVDLPQLDLVLADHLARYAHSLASGGQFQEARQAVREAAAAELRALKSRLTEPFSKSTLSTKA